MDMQTAPNPLFYVHGPLTTHRELNTLERLPSTFTCLILSLKKTFGVALTFLILYVGVLKLTGDQESWDWH